jgi:biotin carboxylase
MAACGIAPEDDDGNAATAAPPQRRVVAQAPAPAKASALDVETITKLAESKGVEVAAVCKAYGVASLTDLLANQVQEAVARLQAAKPKNPAATQE